MDDDVFDVIQKMNIKFRIQNKANCIGHFYSTTEIKLPGMTKKKQLLLHRLVWLLKTGEEPKLTVDHIDINPLNNKFENLRLATRQQQNQHRSMQKSNASGYIGVCYYHYVDKRNNKKYEYDYWLAQIHKPDGNIKAKTFPYTSEGKITAACWYDSKAIEYHGEFHGQLNFPDEIA